jgi:hypothetical protein
MIGRGAADSSDHAAAGSRALELSLGWARPTDIPFHPELGQSTLSPVNRTTPRRPAGHAVCHQSERAVLADA